MKIKKSFNDIENGCLLFLKFKENKDSHNLYNIEQPFLILRDFREQWYYLVDLNINTIVSKHSDLYNLREYLEQEYDIANVIKANKLCLSWED